MADKSYLVLTAVGPDRPGLVSEISSMVHGAGANLEDSRMAILAPLASLASFWEPKKARLATITPCDVVVVAVGCLAWAALIG